MVEIYEYLAVLDLHVIFAERLFGGRIDGLPRHEVEPRQMKRTGDFFAEKKTR